MSQLDVNGLQETADDLARRNGEMRQHVDELKAALRAVDTELWWCAIQLGLNWKDQKWREKSSIGRAYDAAVAALAKSEDRALKGKGE